MIRTRVRGIPIPDQLDGATGSTRRGAADTIHRLVPQNAVEPGTELPLLVEPLASGVDLEEGILSDFPSGLETTYDGACGMNRLSLVTLHEQMEGFPFTLAGKGKKFLIGEGIPSALGGLGLFRNGGD